MIVGTGIVKSIHQNIFKAENINFKKWILKNFIKSETCQYISFIKFQILKNHKLCR